MSASQQVAQYLTHCSSSSSSSSSSSRRSCKDSQYQVEDRLETGRVPSGLVASGKLPGENRSGATPDSSSSFPSSFPAPKHTALVELCCGPGSLIGQEAAKRGLELLRITKDKHDLSTVEGRTAALRDMASLNKGDRVHLWASMPCRPWSQLNELNGRKHGKKFIEYLEGLRQESSILSNVFTDLATIIIDSGGSVSFEWPAYCIGWQIPGLKTSLRKWA